MTGKIPSYLAPDINDSPSAFHFTITPWQELLTVEELRTEEMNGEMNFEEWEEKKKQKEAKDIDNIKAFLTAPASDVPDWMESSCAGSTVSMEPFKRLPSSPLPPRLP